MEKIAGTADISISVVSHAQIALVVCLLKDIEQYCRDSSLEFILTLNLDETLSFDLDGFSFPVKVIRNARPLGFGANHNQAFRFATGRYFCVMNPDITLSSNPFHSLCSSLEESQVGLAAPRVVGSDGSEEDSARYFPRPSELVGKLFGRKSAVYDAKGTEVIYPDWVAGMFMLFPANVFRELSGFDERYFLYYEDVDLCARLALLEYRVALARDVAVMHDARRSSHANLRYLRWHLSSMVRFFFSPAYWQLRKRT